MKTQNAMQPMNERLIVVGGGVMGSAIVGGALRSRTLAPADILVVEPSAEKRHAFSAQGITTMESLAALAIARHDPTAVLTQTDPVSWLAHTAFLLLAIKPQMFPAAAATLRAALRPGDVVISLMAGVPSAVISERLGGVPVVRVMTNTPAKIGLGVTAVTLGAGCEQGHAEFPTRLFRGVGPTVLPLREEMLDAFTAVAGSGPAYLFYLAEGLIAGAQNVGFTADEADAIVRATLHGAAELQRQDGSQSPAELRAAVTSKGGVTQAACETLDEKQVKEALMKAVQAGTARGAELAKLAKE